MWRYGDDLRAEMQPIMNDRCDALDKLVGVWVFLVRVWNAEGCFDFDLELRHRLASHRVELEFHYLGEFAQDRFDRRGEHIVASDRQHVVRAAAHARAGLAGNPSDGYFGKTLSAIVRNYDDSDSAP